MKRKNIHLKRLFYYIGFLSVILVLIIACDEDKIGQYPTDGTSPSTITNIRVEALPGGAKISYDLPNETDISYVTCEYMVKGEKKVARSSIYNNYIMVEGLGEVDPCAFTLYLVDHSENKSAALAGSFTPLEPPYQTIFKSITMEPDFGGVVVRWQNETNALIGAFLYAVNDSTKEWEEYNLVYSTTTEAKYSIRGYNTDERKFGVKLIDQYGNLSDTVIVSAVPLYEKELDKKKFSNGHLLGDNYTSYQNRPIGNIWDGSLSVIWHTDPAGGFTPPQNFTIDLGIEAQLSRIILYNRGEHNSYYYNQHNIHYFEVWGCKELSHGINDPYWSGNDWQTEWVQLGDFEVVKPSGLPLGQITDEDKTVSDAGFEFIFESGVGEMRYIRFVVKETWARTAALHIAEVTLYGDDGIRE